MHIFKGKNQPAVITSTYELYPAEVIGCISGFLQLFIIRVHVLLLLSLDQGS